MPEYTLTEAKLNFSEVVNAVHYTHEPATLLRRGRPWAIIVPALATESREDEDAESDGADATR